MEHSFTPTEWKLMECLWEKGSVTGREAVDYLHAHAAWSRSTTLTMLRRMTEKGVIACGEENGLKVYSPLVDREAAALRETEDFLSRVYKGSLGMLMSAVTKKQELSREEIDELYAILREAEEGVKHD